MRLGARPGPCSAGAAEVLQALCWSCPILAKQKARQKQTGRRKPTRGGAGGQKRARVGNGNGLGA